METVSPFKRGMRKLRLLSGKWNPQTPLFLTKCYRKFCEEKLDSTINSVCFLLGDLVWYFDICVLMDTDSVRKWRHWEAILLRHTHLYFLPSSSLPQHLEWPPRLLMWKQDLWLQFHLWLLLISHLKLWVQLCQHSLFLMWKKTPCGWAKYIPFSLSPETPFSPGCFGRLSLGCVPI